MMLYKTEQKVYKIGGIEIGGQAGEYPTVLISSIFYSGHKIVSDAEKGLFDRAKAEELIRRQEEVSEYTGNPCILDVVGENPEALIKYIDFVAGVTDLPFLMDGITPEARTQAAKHVSEAGLTERAVYNSIGYTTTNEEINSIKDLAIKSAIVFAFDPKDPSPAGKLRILKERKEKEGLLEYATKAGIPQLLIDTGVLDVASIVLSSLAIDLIKQEYGYPSGCAPANAVSTWETARRSKIFRQSCESAICTFPITFNADFILYGPIEAAERVFPAVATYNALLAYNIMWEFKRRPKTKNHPLYKLMH